MKHYGHMEGGGRSRWVDVSQNLRYRVVRDVPRMRDRKDDAYRVMAAMVLSTTQVISLPQWAFRMMEDGNIEVRTTS